MACHLKGDSLEREVGAIVVKSVVLGLLPNNIASVSLDFQFGLDTGYQGPNPAQLDKNQEVLHRAEMKSVLNI